MNSEFERRRRQPYIDSQAYHATLRHFDDDLARLAQSAQAMDDDKIRSAQVLSTTVAVCWDRFLLLLTGGEAPSALSLSLTELIDAYERYDAILQEVPDHAYVNTVTLDHSIDDYVDYVNLLSAAILLHREDLIDRIYGLIAGSDYDAEDLIIEELLSFYLPERPEVDEWFWERPYGKLVDVIDAETDGARQVAMKRYVSGWYRAMKGQAQFWGRHEKIQPNFSPYFGYWALCSGAFSYLYNIDDSSYRDELVYPRDLVDYARSLPRKAIDSSSGSAVIRVVGGDKCPREGRWYTPALAGSTRSFKLGEVMPTVDSSDYGVTIWQWEAN